MKKYKPIKINVILVVALTCDKGTKIDYDEVPIDSFHLGSIKLLKSYEETQIYGDRVRAVVDFLYSVQAYHYDEVYSNKKTLAYSTEAKRGYSKPQWIVYEIEGLNPREIKSVDILLNDMIL